MTVSKVNIFNMALNELGVSAIINNPEDEKDTRAIILRNYYENAKDEVLKAFDWNFAEKYRILSLTNEQCLDPRFEYMYDYPQDCLNARELFEENGDRKKKKFKLSSSSNGQKVILANVNPAVLRYTRKINNDAFLDSEFAVALSLYLAGMTGKAITGSEQKANASLQKYWDKVRLSRIANASEGQEVDEDDTTYIDSRN